LFGRRPLRKIFSPCLTGLKPLARPNARSSKPHVSRLLPHLWVGRSVNLLTLGRGYYYNTPHIRKKVWGAPGRAALGHKSRGVTPWQTESLKGSKIPSTYQGRRGGPELGPPVGRPPPCVWAAEMFSSAGVGSLSLWERSALQIRRAGINAGMSKR